MNKIVCAVLLLFFVTTSFYAQDKTFVDIDSMSDEVFPSVVDRMVASKNRKSIAQLEQLALQLIDLKRFVPAEKVYQTLLKQEPSKKKTYLYNVQLGDIYERQAKYSNSLDYYKKAQELYPKKLDINLKIGDVLLKSNLYNLAQQSFLDALKINKKSNHAREKLGEIYFKQGLYTQALEYYKTINDDYLDRQLIANVVVCYQELNKVDEALEFINKHLASYDDAQLHILTGQLYMQVNKHAEAEKQFLISVGMDGKNYIAYMYLARLYMANDNLPKTKEFLDKAYSLNQSTAIIDLMYARIFYKAGKTAEARQYANRALTKAKTPFVKEQVLRFIEFVG